MAKKITLSTDSTADLGAMLYKKFDIRVIHFGIVIGDKEYRDGIDIKPENIYQAVEKQKIVPKTAAGTEEDYKELFKETTKDGGQHIHISISNKLSVARDNAIRVAKDFPNVYIVDSLSLSTGTGILCILAREMIDAGMDAKEIAKTLEAKAQKIQCSFVLDELKYMHRGGRCSAFKLFGANLLRIHPELHMEKDGRLVQGKLFRGKYQNVVKNYTDYILEKFPNADKSFVFVTHTTMVDSATEKQVEADLRAAGFQTIYNTAAGSVITTHCGRNCIGILFCEK